MSTSGPVASGTNALDDRARRNTPEALIDRLGVAMVDLTAAVRHNTNSNVTVLAVLATLSETLAAIEQKLAASGEARSSVQVEQGAKDVRLTVKAYDHSPVGPIGDEALREFARLFREIEQQQMNGWHETLAQQAEER